MNPFKDNPLLLIIFTSLIILLSSCASTITQKETAGTEITFSITFQNPPEFTGFNYYIVYAEDSFKLNTNLSNNYFFIPGEPFDPHTLQNVSKGDGLSYYYNNYFHTWGGIIKLDSSDISITTGPFSKTLQEETDHFNYEASKRSINRYALIGSTIAFTLPVSDLALNGNTLHFSIVTTKIGNSHNIEDLVVNIQTVEIISNRPPVTGKNDLSLFNPNESAEIVSWTVTVQ